MDSVLIDSFARLLEDIAQPEQVRAAEAAGTPGPAWEALRESGFCDALNAEDHGGFGLCADDVAPLLVMAGEQLLPVPLGETMVARALLSAAGIEPPADAPILLWPADAAGALRSAVAPVGVGPAYALCQSGERLSLRRVANAAERDGFGFFPATLVPGVPEAECAGKPDLLMLWAAALAAATAAGGIARLVAMTVQHANERNQFGRPLAKFQAIQHQLSIMAEQSVMAAVGARAALRDAGVHEGPQPWRVAAARSVGNEAGRQCAAIAHAVHGAIGISAEHNLQLVTRRVKRLCLGFGSGQYWAGELGAIRLASPAATTLDFFQPLTPAQGAPA